MRGRRCRLSPLDDPLTYHPFCALAVTGLFAGRFGEAASYARLTVQANPAFSVALCLPGGGARRARRPRGRARAAARLLAVAPGFTVAGFARMNVFRRERTEGIAGALVRAGLPAG